MASWLTVQREQLRQGLFSIRGKQHLTVTQPFFRVDGDVPNVTTYWADDTYFRRDEAATVDIFFNQGYSPDRDRVAYVRSTSRAALHATWFWDNHHLVADTMHAALLSDVYFCAHGYASSYIRNKLALNGGFTPLCPVFWLVSEAKEAATRGILAPRSEKLYGGYNSYAEFPDRDVLIERIKSRIPNNNIFTTAHGTPPDQHPFYSMTPVDRLLEWMSYKVSLCLSFGSNTAMRIFDMLLGGGIPLIVGRPADLDSIFPHGVQESLPIIVVDDVDPDAIAAGFEHSLKRFDEGGLDGVMTRHAYTLANHMPHHRLGQMIDKIRGFAEQADDLDHVLDG